MRARHRRTFLAAVSARRRAKKGRAASPAPRGGRALWRIIGRHVVLGPPHGAVVLEVELAGALVGQLDVAHEVLQLLGIAAFREDLAELFQILAALQAARTILSLPYVPSMELVMRVSSSLSLGSLGVAMVSPNLSRRILRAVTGRGRLGVVGDLGIFGPLGVGGIDVQHQQLLLGIVNELARFFGGCLGVGPRRQRTRRCRRRARHGRDTCLRVINFAPWVTAC
jgi:hypothetical protein